MNKGVIAKGATLKESNGQQWIVGTFIGLNGITESYEAASYDDKAPRKVPTDYPAILQIVPKGEPLPTGFEFYLKHANPNDLDKWKKVKRVKHLGIPVLLGAGILKINDQVYKFIIIERHGKDLGSLFSDHDKEFEEHTVYKITLQLISALKYVHSKSYTLEDIGVSNIVVDVATQNHIYLLNRHLASYPVGDNPNKTCNSAAVLLSRDAHKGVSTKRGDMEILFYNMVQWLGIELPWEKHFKNPALVLKEKEYAFADVEKFLQNCSSETEIPTTVCEYMKLLATLDANDGPVYSNFTHILSNGLRKLYHVPTGNLEFSISNIPNLEEIAEDSDQKNEPQSKYTNLTAIPKLGIAVAKVAKIIAENCRHEAEVKLQEVGPGSLINIVFSLTMKKKNATIQMIIANAWDRDTAGLKTMTKRLWKKKASKPKKRTTNEAILAEKGHEKSNQKKPTVAAASTKAGTSRPNCSNPHFSQSHPVAMSPRETPVQEDSALVDRPNISPSSVSQTWREPRSDFPSWSHADQSPVFRTGSSGYDSRNSSRVDFPANDCPLFRTPDPFLEKEPCQSSKQVAVEANVDADCIDETVTKCWRSESVDDDQWLKAYEWLSTWLKLKEPALSAFGPIPSEPKRAISQAQDVRVLLDDFRTRTPQVRQLASVLARLPPESVDAQKLDRIQQRWREQLAWLEERGRKLGEAILGQAREALQDVSSDLDKLLDQIPEEQLRRKIENLAGQLEAQSDLLASAGTVTEKLVYALSDAAVNADLQNELQSVHNLYDDLERRINVKKAEIDKNLSDERQLHDSCKEIIVWLAKELAVSEKFTVSADPGKLRQQQEHCRLVLGKKSKVKELLSKGRDFFSKPQNLENVKLQQSLLDLIESQWPRLKKYNEEIFSKLQTSIEHCDKYYERRNLFLDWLNKAEDEFKCLQPSSIDNETLLEKLTSLGNKVRAKSDEFEKTTKLGEAFVGVCDEDSDNAVKNELADIKNRWEKLNNDLLESTACRYAVFNKRLNKLELRVNELTSHDALREEARDPNLIDCIKGLRSEADFLQEPLQHVRQLANELGSKVSEMGIDSGRLSKEVDRVATAIESVRIKIRDHLNQLLELRVAIIEKDIKPEIDAAQVQDEKPRIRLPNTNQSSEEVVDLVSDGEGEADFAAEEKPRWLPSLTDPVFNKALIDLVSSSDSEDEPFTPQQGQPSSDSVNRNSISSKKKRKRFLSDSNDSGSDCDEKKRKERIQEKKENDSEI